MKEISLLGMLLLILVIKCGAQTDDPPQVRMNGVYTEFYVIRPDFSEGFLSLNYERTLGKKNRLNCRIGIWPDFESTV